MTNFEGEGEKIIRNENGQGYYIEGREGEAKRLVEGAKGAPGIPKG